MEIDVVQDVDSVAAPAAGKVKLFLLCVSLPSAAGVPEDTKILRLMAKLSSGTVVKFGNSANVVEAAL